jgi:hypothetical protein
MSQQPSLKGESVWIPEPCCEHKNKFKEAGGAEGAAALIPSAAGVGKCPYGKLHSSIHETFAPTVQ